MLWAGHVVPYLEQRGLLRDKIDARMWLRLSLAVAVPQGYLSVLMLGYSVYGVVLCVEWIADVEFRIFYLGGKL